MIILLSAALFQVAPAWADYRVEAGDVVELSIGGLVDLRQRAAVQPDGTITVPQVGTIAVSGLLPAEIKTKVQAALLSKPIRVRAADGSSLSVMVAPDEVAAAVVEYRPFYIMGDVSKPGQYPFRPAMTVRQAMAMAGGYDRGQAGYQYPIFEASNLQSEYDADMVQLAGLEIHALRMKAELADREEMDKTPPSDVQAPAAALSNLMSAEIGLFKTRRAEFLREKDFFERSIKRHDDAIAILTEQLNKESEGAQVDEQELQDIIDLYKKGNVNNARLTDSRRAVLLSATRKLQISVQLYQAKQQRSDLQKQLDSLTSQRKIGLLTDLQDNTIKETELRTKLQNASHKLALISMMRAQPEPDAKPNVVVVRKGEKGRERLSVDEDFELEPGDVVEVAIVFEHREPAAPRS